MSNDRTYPAKLGMKSSTETTIVHYEVICRQRKTPRNIEVIDILRPWLHTESHGHPSYRASIGISVSPKR